MGCVNIYLSNPIYFIYLSWVTVVSKKNVFHFYVLDIDLKVAAKFFGTKFACGSSVTGDDEIVIQGDVKDDLCDIIPEKWPEVYKLLLINLLNISLDVTPINT